MCLAAGEIDLKGAKLRSRTRVDAVKGYLDEVYKLKRNAAAGDAEKLKEIEADYQNDFENFVVKGLDVSDISNIVKGDEVQERIFEAAEANVKAKGIDEDDPRFSEELIIEATRITQEYGKNLQSGFAKGGPVAMTEDVNVMTQTPAGITDVNMSETETVSPTEAAPMQLTYDQLRARLPKEIGDEIVTLLANSLSLIHISEPTRPY